MRRICYSVASSLDGFIAGPNGEIDWIPHAPDVDADLAANFARYDTLLIGRGTFELMIRQGQTTLPGMRSIVISTTLRPEAHPEVTVSNNALETVAALRAEPGKDIWLFGGGQLFRSLLDRNEVDSIDVAVFPVLLGSGVPLLPPPYTPTVLALKEHHVYPASGTIALRYDVVSRSVRTTE